MVCVPASSSQLLSPDSLFLLLLCITVLQSLTVWNRSWRSTHTWAMRPVLQSCPCLFVTCVMYALVHVMALDRVVSCSIWSMPFIRWLWKCEPLISWAATTVHRMSDAYRLPWRRRFDEAYLYWLRIISWLLANKLMLKIMIHALLPPLDYIFFKWRYFADTHTHTHPI